MNNYHVVYFTSICTCIGMVVNSGYHGKSWVRVQEGRTYAKAQAAKPRRVEAERWIEDLSSAEREGPCCNVSTTGASTMAGEHRMGTKVTTWAPPTATPRGRFPYSSFLVYRHGMNRTVREYCMRTTRALHRKFTVRNTYKGIELISSN